MVQRGDMLNREDILEILAVPLVGIVPEHEDIVISANRGRPVVFDDDSPVGAAYRRITQRVLGEQLPIPDFEADPGFWTSFMRWMGLAPAREVV
jgi:septum site-determining protein MinD